MIGRVCIGPYSFDIASGVLYIYKVDYAEKHSFNFVQVLHTHPISASFPSHNTLKLPPKHSAPQSLTSVSFTYRVPLFPNVPATFICFANLVVGHLFVPSLSSKALVPLARVPASSQTSPLHLTIYPNALQLQLLCSPTFSKPSLS